MPYFFDSARFDSARSHSPSQAPTYPQHVMQRPVVGTEVALRTTCLVQKHANLQKMQEGNGNRGNQATATEGAFLNSV